MIFSIVVFLCGLVFEYISALFLRYSDNDVRSFFECSSSKWPEVYPDIKNRKLVRYGSYTLFSVVLLIFSYYFMLIFEQIVGSKYLGQMGILLLLTNLIDLFIFGVTPGN